MDKILQYLKENRDRFLQELCTYLEFESISAQPQHDKDVRRCAEWIAAHCKDLGMKAEIAPTKGHPVVIAQTPRTRSSKHKPHYIVYGHYDVQPPDPLELWNSPPFKPKIENNRIYARGVSDNKGQHFAHLKAVEAYLRTGTELPCNLTFIIEGEEEVGSKHLTD
ncbi:MAG TPA: M20/M25/M40 family metallo-hydrolase, partial [Verrucomicrobia bacterium]|nr:M20/M25/M40 family metallo-hydrolase [Verrucomicrobiota bacterium]